MAYNKEFLLSLYRKMAMIRQFEERVKHLFLEGIMPGTIHQYHGQEATAVGACSVLDDPDVITSTHRPHGHALARGLTVESLMHELFGKVTGCCRGKGGSVHMGDLSKGMVPAIAIVAGGIPIATGIALAFKMKKEPGVVVAFMGHGAAMMGLRPIVDVQYSDFIHCAMDQVVNQIAKMRYMSGEKLTTPLVMRAPVGATGRGAQRELGSVAPDASGVWEAPQPPTFEDRVLVLEKVS